MWRDLRASLRRLRSSPGYTLLALASLSLGIGATTAMFSLVHAALLREPALERPAEVVNVYATSPELSFHMLSHPDFLDLREATPTVFDGFAASEFSLLESGSDDGVEQLMTEFVTGDSFPTLGVDAALGRLLAPEDHVAPGAHPVVVLGYRYWQRAFGADRGVVGRELRLGGHRLEIVGVAPQSYRSILRGVRSDVFVPLSMRATLETFASDPLEDRARRLLSVQARLTEGRTVEQARLAVAALAEQQKRRHPEHWRPLHGMDVFATRDVVLFPQFDGAMRRGGLALLAAVGLVLVIASVNLASFLLARTHDRRREIGLRLALGASRRRLLEELLAESWLLVVVSTVAALGIAATMIRAFEASDLPTPVPLDYGPQIDGAVFLFAVVVAALAGSLFALLPSWRATRLDPLVMIRASPVPGVGVSLRGALLAIEVAITLVLLTAAGLLWRSLQSVEAIDPGFGERPTALLTLIVPADAPAEAAAGPATLDALLREVEALPGVEAAGLTTTLPLAPLGPPAVDLEVPGVEPPPGEASHRINTHVVSRGFFAAMGIELVGGRPFRVTDDVSGAPVAVISETFAQRFWPGENAVGRVLRRPGGGELTVVGVARDSKVRALTEQPTPLLYLPYTQSPSAIVHLLATTDRRAEGVAVEMLRLVRERLPRARIRESSTLARHLDVVRFPPRALALAWGCLAGVALLVSGFGLYGMVSYGQVRRRREVGIRLALGADGPSVVGLLVRGGLRPVVAGLLLGVAVALASSRSIQGLLVGDVRLGPSLLLAVGGFVAGVACLAAWLPARRASKVDPAVTLRSE